MATQAADWLETAESYATVHHPRSPKAQKENTELAEHTPECQSKDKNQGEIYCWDAGCDDRRFLLELLTFYVWEKNSFPV